MGAMTIRGSGTIGATPFTIFLARIFLPGFLRGLRTTSARDYGFAFSVESDRPQKTCLTTYLLLRLKAREISRSISRFLMVSRLSNSRLPLAKANSTLTMDPLK